MENFIVSLRCITPVLLVMCLGILIRARKLVPEETYERLSTLCFHCLLPFQLFYNIYDADLEGAFSPRLLIFLEAGALIWFAVNYALFAAMEPDRRARGAYIQNAFRSNIAIVGVSLAQSLMGDGPGVASMALATAVLIPTFNTLAVFTLESCRGGRADVGSIVRQILKNPLIRASVLGVIFLLLELRLPQPVEQAVKSLGTTGSTMTLVALGASLRLERVRKNLRRAILCSAHRLVIAPLVMVAAACLLGFQGNDLGVILICAGAPTAAASYPMALACGSDHELTAQVVVSTSMFFCLTMLFWIFGLKQLGLM